MNQMGHIRDGLKCNLGAIECATPCRTPRLQLLGTTFLALLFGLGLILSATRLVEDVLNLSRNAAHGHLQNTP